MAKVLVDNRDKHLSSDEIHIKIKRAKKTLNVTLFQSIEFSAFDDIGLVKKSLFQGDAARYTLKDLSTSHNHHHEHFFKCISCKIIEPFSECLVGKKRKKQLECQRL